MIAYFIMLSILIICVFIENTMSTQKSKNSVFLFALLPYFVLMALKDRTIGTDTEGYFLSFAAMANYDFKSFLSMDDLGYERIEKGYKLFIWLLTRISNDGQLLLLATAIVSTLALYSFIKNNANNKSLALFFFITLGFFQFAMTGIRQTLAISVTLFGYKYIREQKLLIFLIFALVATQFHKSAIFFLPLYLVARMKMTSTNIGMAILLIVVLYFSANSLLFFAADFLDYDYGIEQTGNGYIFFAIVLLITILSLISRKNLIYQRRENSIFLNLNFISLATWTLRLVSRTAERVSLYYMPYTYVLFEQYLTNNRNKNRMPLMVLAMVLCTYLFYRRISIQEDLNHFRFFF